MIKILLNILLNIVLGHLKPILLKRIEEIDASMISDSAKRDVVFNNFKADVQVAGRQIRDSIINLAIECAVTLLKDKTK